MELVVKENFKYKDRIDSLKRKKLAQTKEKIDKEGLLDEDDYGRVVPPENSWKIIPNHPDGSFYGVEGWTTNFCSLMDNHPVYVDPDDAFSGRWMYFMSKMRPNKWNPDYPYDHLKNDIKKYDIICGIGEDAHFAPDFEIGLKLGWRGLIEKIDTYSKINNSSEQVLFYESHKKAIQSVQGWIRRHNEKIEKLLNTEENTEKRDNLLEMYETNVKIIDNPPETLREACQWIIWYHLASRTYNRDGAGGQIDSLLQPYYERDINLTCVEKLFENQFSEEIAQRLNPTIDISELRTEMVEIGFNS